ncbi:hypothetical protein [Altibacter sp. HG106]|uniref:hypothetical protein n=1 Tax=Altibacter sp. HG106 TaxID=3023937 RepID=UPI002350DEAD|nr:hypothetical protein [Altibacter sp. HG106]MDC7994821.1 hypothetical protein [Altibacter sp. HG106]
MKLYSKLNISEVFSKHLKTFYGRKNQITPKDKFEWVVLPLIISILLALWHAPSQNTIDNLAICLSILIGLLLNLLVLILSSANDKNLKLSEKNKDTRLYLIEETFSNISFAIILNIAALLLLFIFSIEPNPKLINLIDIELYGKIYEILVFIKSFLIYFLSVEIFLHLFMILKRINVIFSNDLKMMR